MTNKNTLVMTMFCLMTVACGGTGEPLPLDEQPVDGPAAEIDEDTLEDDREELAAPKPSHDEDGLALDVSTDSAVAGELSAEGEHIRFDIQKSADRHVTVVYGSDGTQLLRATIAGATEKLELGGVRDAGGTFGCGVRWKGTTLGGRADERRHHAGGRAVAACGLRSDLEAGSDAG